MLSIEKEHKKEMEKYKEYLHSIISVENKKGMSIKEFVREGIPSEIVLKMVADENIDLLILRSHEEGRLERMLVGGNNDEIIRAMPCSIFLVKQETCDVDLNKVTTSVKSASGKNKNNENIHHLRLRKGDAMNQQISDQKWQQLQDHIEGFFSHTLTNDVQRIEYKPLSYKAVAAK